MMGKLGSLFSLVALCASIVNSSPATYSPSGASDINLAVAVPSSVASAGSGDIYLQLSAPSTYRWIAMGIGSAMNSATMFVVYSSGDGNVTISPRRGRNHIQPLFDSSITVELLAGSGVQGNVMTANVKYTVDPSALKTSSSDTNWIAAWQQGSAIGSTSTSATITQHDAHDQFGFDLTKATISSSSNPYVSTASSSGSGSSSGTGTGTGTATGTGASSTATSHSSPSSSGSGSSSGAISIKVQNPAIFQKAHGILMGSSFVVLFPVGAIIMSTVGGIWLHAAIQMLSLFAVLAALGIGIHLAKLKHELFQQTHTIFGLVIVILLVFQPFVGMLHHRQYKKLGQRSYFGHAHLWYGRILIIVGIINGGLGLRLASNTKHGEIAYGVVAGVMFVVYLVAVVISPRRKTASQGGRQAKREGS